MGETIFAALRAQRGGGPGPASPQRPSQHRAAPPASAARPWRRRVCVRGAGRRAPTAAPGPVDFGFGGDGDSQFPSLRVQKHPRVVIGAGRAKGDVKRVDGSRQSRGQQRSPCPFWRAELILLCSSEPSSTYNVKSARTVSCTPSFQSTADKWSRAGSSGRARAWPGGRSWLQSVWTWHRASSYPSF